jgi:hypothetical protein
VRRLFWLGLGVGAGATAVIGVRRFARRQAERVSPAALAREAKGGVLDFSRLVAESMEEGKRAMADAEARARDQTRAKGGAVTDRR